MCYCSSLRRHFSAFRIKRNSEVLQATKVTMKVWELLQIALVFKPVIKSLHQDICSLDDPVSFLLILYCLFLVDFTV